MQKHAQKATVTRASIVSANIAIYYQDISDSNFCLLVKDLVDLVKSDKAFEIEDKTLIYSYKVNIGNTTATVCKRIELFPLQDVFQYQEPLLTLTIPKLKCLTNDKTVVNFSKNKLILESSGYIKTRVVLEAKKARGVDEFSINVSGKGLKIAEELKEELAMCFYNDCVVIFKFEGNLSTAVIIN
ncbi:hypothetical protein GINT2_001226 [Glugoides intestinalis]